jgi:lambda family phage portal protein
VSNTSIIQRTYDAAMRLVAPRVALRNAQARAMLDAGKFGYSAARRSRIQATKLGLGGSGDKHATSSDLWQLREYSRALDRDNVIASAMLDRACEAIIGTGIDLQVQSGDKTWDAEVEARWSAWWDTEADIRGMLCGWQIEAMAYRAMKVDGDILLVMLGTGQVQAIEADRIATPPELSQSPLCINGVQVDAQGRPLVFWIAPLDTTTSSGRKIYGKKDIRPINAADCVYLPNMNRFSLTRGVPTFATNMQLFDDIDAFIETCVVHAKIAASHVLFVERQNGPANIDSVETVQDADDNDRQEQVVSPGMIMYGRPGERAQMVGTTQTMVQFGPFVQQLLRFTGLNFGMPLEMLSLDFSQTNYSSARAAMLVAHRSFVCQHKLMTQRMLAPILRWKVREWVRDGMLERPFQVSATPPKNISVDPQKDAAADVLKVQNGFTTNREVCAAWGMDWEQIMNQRAEEIKLAMDKAAGLSSEGGGVVDWHDLLGANADAPPPVVDGEDEPTAEGEEDADGKERSWLT